MFSTIVVAMDGSEGAEKALAPATELAREGGGKLVIAHVVEMIAAKGDMPPVHPDEAKIIEGLKKNAADLSAAGVETTFESETCVLGGPARGILDIADRVGADLIVAGTRGHSSITGLLVGSVTHRLLHISPRPVLVIPSDH